MKYIHWCNLPQQTYGNDHLWVDLRSEGDLGRETSFVDSLFSPLKI